MKFPVTYETILRRFDENKMKYEVLKLQNDASIIITAYGGRILGPFFSNQAESILWASDLFASTDGFKLSVATGEWNLGGERIWIAPEIFYNVTDRTDFWGSYHLPPEIDPGHYVLERPRSDYCSLSQDMKLTGYGSYNGDKELHLERRISKADNPLTNLEDCDDLLQHVDYAGFEHLITLSDIHADEMLSEAWDLLQLKSGGVLFISTLPHAQHTDYYTPVSELFQHNHGNHVRLEITGNRKYKVGYKSASITGRAAYMNVLPDTRTCLIIRSFHNNPSAYYSEEPFGMPGCHGHSLHVYNDDGSIGSFGELECNGQTIGGFTGKSSSTDCMSLWIYAGDEGRIKSILYRLLGIKI